MCKKFERAVFCVCKPSTIICSIIDFLGGVTGSIELVKKDNCNKIKTLTTLLRSQQCDS